jgi:mono/diheme cytochrome c family protein
VAVYGWNALSASSQAPPVAQSAARVADVGATIEKYCVTCHNQRLKTGNLALDAPELSNVAAHADVWEKVIRKVRAGMMPPAGLPRPDAASRDALVARLESTLDSAARSVPCSIADRLSAEAAMRAATVDPMSAEVNDTMIVKIAAPMPTTRESRASAR